MEEKLLSLEKTIKENIKSIKDFKLKKLINSKEIQNFLSDSFSFFSNPIDIKFTLNCFQSLKFDQLFKTSSDILKSHQNNLYLYDLFKTEGKAIKDITRIYKASDYEFKAGKFHEMCDNKGPTLVVVQAKDSKRVFGGYASESWNASKNGYYSAPGSFLFQLDFKSKHKIYQNDEYALNSSPSHNPIFGYNGDLYLSDNCNTNKQLPSSSFSNLGYTYSLPLINAINNIHNPNNEYMTYDSDEAQSYLAGSFDFEVSEFEVFTISFV